jgi:hypothetical protein
MDLGEYQHTHGAVTGIPLSKREEQAFPPEPLVRAFFLAADTALRALRFFSCRRRKVEELHLSYA